MQKLLNKFGKVSSGIATSFVLYTSQVHADAADYLPDLEGAPSKDLIPWIQGVLNLVIGISGLISVVILIVAGYMFITASGNEEQIQKATKTLTYAIIGLVICLISVLVVQFVLGKVIGN